MSDFRASTFARRLLALPEAKRAAIEADPLLVRAEQGALRNDLFSRAHYEQWGRRMEALLQEAEVAGCACIASSRGL